METYEDIFGTLDLTINNIPDVSSGDGVVRSTEQCKEWAESIGCDIIEAKDNELFIDIDSEHQFTQFNLMLPLFKRHFYYTNVDVQPSKQGLPHRHIKITMANDYPLLTRIGFQACLGSDSMRELLSMKRAIEGEDNVVIFFEKKGSK